MAYITSDNYKELIYSETSEQYLNIIINGEAINRNYVRNIKVKDDVFDSDVFTLGNATICEWELELDNELVSTLDDFDEVEIEHVLVLSDSTNEVIPLGTYMVQKQDDNTDNYTKYKLYDYMKKFDVEVDFSSIVPCTRYELAKYLCDQCGVPLANSSFINGDIEVSTYDNTLSAKTYLVLISERAGGFAKVNRNKQLVIKSFGEVDVHELPVNKMGEYKTDKLRIISKVIYENSLQKFEAGDDTGETVFLTSESIFACSQEEVDNIYNSIKGLQYQSLEVRIWGNPAIDTGDIIKANGMISFAQKDWSFGNGFYGKYKTTLKKSDKGSNVTKIPAKDKIKRIQATLDEDNMKITQLIKNVDGQNKKITSFEESLEGITSSVESQEKELEDLSNSIGLFSTDLDIYTLSIPVKSTQYPVETKEYVINFYSYFKGTQITPSVKSNSSNDGISVSISDKSITLGVNTSTKIANANNMFEFEFSYTSEGVTYTATKKVSVSLSLGGTDGKNGNDGATGATGATGASAYETWLNQGNTGTEAQFIESLKGEDGESTYVYVKYSASADGSNMTDAPTDTTEYTGIATTTSPTAPTSASAYKWQKTVGKDGIGIDGTSSYLHIKWSEDGVTFSGENQDGKTPARWQGTYVSTSETDSTNFDDYNWVDTAVHVDEELAGIKDDLLSAENKITTVENDLKENYLTGEEVKTMTNENSDNIEVLKNQLATMELTSSELSIQIGSILTDGVNKVKTATGFTFDENGLDISKDGEEMHNFMDNEGVYVKRNDEEVLGADADGVRGENFWAKKYLKIGNNSRIEDYNTNRTGVFYVG